MTRLMFGFFERRLEPFPSAPVAPPPPGFRAFVWHYMRDAWGWLLALALLTAMISAGEVLLFSFLGNLVDWVAAADRDGFFERERNGLIAIGALVLVGLPLAVLLQSTVLHQTLLGNLPMNSRWRMHQQLLSQSMQFYSTEFAGRVATKLMQTSLALRETVIKLLDVFVYVIVFFITTLVVVAAADWRLAILLGVWLVIYVGLVAYFVPRLRVISEKQADARSVMTGRIVDSYTNIATVKLFAHAGREAQYAKDSMRIFLNTVYPQMRLVTLFQSLVYFNNCLVIFGIFAASIYLWSIGQISVGAIATAVALVMRLNGTSQWIMWEVSGLFENIGTVMDGRELLTRRIAVTDCAKADTLERPNGDISFSNVTFHYGKDGGVLENFSLDIAAGEKVGLVGRSGAGKSTLVNLLLRFYDVEGGRIAIDGKDIRDLTQDSLRAQIGVVTQDTALLHRSIRDNIGYGRAGASDAAIIEAARRANALDFIMDLEDQHGRRGLDAQVGERGVRLSGGQRQRIAIARVFLKDAPILVLDEATSALDSEVEAAIQENLFELMKGKTVIAIAHRLSTIAQLDRLIVIDKGKIVETGTHERLVNGAGLYASLWARQSGGFLDAGETAEPNTQ